MANIVVLISGNGSNLQAIIDSTLSGAIKGSVAAVISNKPEVYGLERAAKANIPAITIDHTQFADRTEFEGALIEAIDRYQPDLVVLAGFMRILSSDFVQHYLGKMLNIHPSLLPKYPGLNTHQRVLENGDEEHGTSVHFVTAELDGGPIIAQRSFHVTADDTAETLQQKVQQQEHQLYPEVVSWFCAGRLQFKDGAAWLDNQPITL